MAKYRLKKRYREHLKINRLPNSLRKKYKQKREEHLRKLKESEKALKDLVEEDTRKIEPPEQVRRMQTSLQACMIELSKWLTPKELYSVVLEYVVAYSWSAFKEETREIMGNPNFPLPAFKIRSVSWKNARSKER